LPGFQRTVTLGRGSVLRAGDLPPEARFYKASEQGSLVERLEAVERVLNPLYFFYAVERVLNPLYFFIRV